MMPENIQTVPQTSSPCLSQLTLNEKRPPYQQFPVGSEDDDDDSGSNTVPGTLQEFSKVLL